MPSTQRKPNIVFVLTDDQGYGDLGCTGNPIIQTPHIDRLHDESVRLRQFHVGPTCAPTRATLFTGHYANSTGVWHTIGGRSLLRSDEWTLPAALAGAGYDTGLFGKWHLGDSYPYRPMDRGFATSVVHGGGGISQTPDYWGNDYFDDTYLVNGQPTPFEGYCTDVFFREAIDYIASRDGRPFFCCITTNAPHDPYNVDDRYADPYRSLVPEDRARFYGMIANIDENIARLRSALDEQGLAENTILIFMTDNGTSGGGTFDIDHHLIEGYNAGMRGKKNSEYDGGHRTPCFMHWPGGGLTGGRDVDRLTASIDLMPTLLELCGVQPREGANFHGRSLAPLLNDPHAAWPDRAVVTDSQRLPCPMKWHKSAVMTDRWRLVNGCELYDILADPGQQDDIAAEHPDVVAHLRDEYEQWWQIVSTQFDGMIPFPVGDPACPKTKLNIHDARNEISNVPYMQGMIRQGDRANGYWEIEIKTPGRYEVLLRRWPEETARPLTAGIDGDDVPWSPQFISPVHHVNYTGGKALPITGATLRIGTMRWYQAAEPGSEAVRFLVDLTEGQTTIEAAFHGETDVHLSAYYVHIQPAEEHAPSRT